MTMDWQRFSNPTEDVRLHWSVRYEEDGSSSVEIGVSGPYVVRQVQERARYTKGLGELDQFTVVPVADWSRRNGFGWLEGSSLWPESAEDQVKRWLLVNMPTNVARRVGYRQ